jgi:hypothetical protein
VTREQIDRLLQRLELGEVSREAAIETLARLPYRDLGPARIDTHRELRQGIAEIVLGQGKSPEQIVDIVRGLAGDGGNVLVTRVTPDVAARVRAGMPELQHLEEARLLVLRQAPIRAQGLGTVLVVTAGTSDLPVAEEAAAVAELHGNKVERLWDVGVAGLHRVLAALDTLRAARVVIVVAGMDGALPAVVAGLIARPVIAVPTSVGYGASFGGVAALLGMLNACATNVAVVNIDNGVGAACLATLINRG